MIDLRTALPYLLPKAIEWAEKQQSYILSSGFELSADQLSIARGVGVVRPEEIRVKLVERLPSPGDPELAQAVLQTGLLGPNMVGITFFYGIYICERAFHSRNLIAHECRHVYQYEQKGSIISFLQEYLLEIVTHGYARAPLEQDAQRAAAKYV